MVLMFASDLHGSAYWTKKLLEAFRKERADMLVLLGDLLEGNFDGLSSNDDCPNVAEQLNDIKDRIIAVRGNCDSEEDQVLLDFPMMEEALQLDVNGLRLHITHGHLQNGHENSEMVKGAVVVRGHSHVPACEPRGTRLYVNPGSAARPRAGSVRSYLMLHGRTFTWKALDGIAYHSYTVE